MFLTHQTYLKALHLDTFHVVDYSKFYKGLLQLFWVAHETDGQSHTFHHLQCMLLEQCILFVQLLALEGKQLLKLWSDLEQPARNT